VNEVFYSEGLQFSCTQCSNCCRNEPGYVYLSKKDLTNLCECFNINSEEFTQTYCRTVPYHDGTDVLCLKEKLGYDCILWDNGCTAYRTRPIQCSTYPFWSFIVKNRQTWDKECSSCPGINNGVLRTKKEIEKHL